MDNELTQPMLITPNLVESRQGNNNQCSDLPDLFAFTQDTQPMDQLSEFKPITRGYPSVEKNSSLPPLPPSQMDANKRKTDNLISLTSIPAKRHSETVKPSSKSRRESTQSTVLSKHGLFRKTHDVISRVQLADSNQNTVNASTEDQSRHSPSNLSGKRIAKTPSRSSSLNLRSSILRKYRRYSKDSRSSPDQNSSKGETSSSYWRSVRSKLSFNSGSLQSLLPSRGSGERDSRSTSIERKSMLSFKRSRSFTPSRLSNALSNITKPKLLTRKKPRLKQNNTGPLIVEHSPFPALNEAALVPSAPLTQSSFSNRSVSMTNDIELSKVACKFILPTRHHLYSNPPIKSRFSIANMSLSSRLKDESLVVVDAASLVGGDNLKASLSLNASSNQTGLPMTESLHCSSCGETLVLDISSWMPFADRSTASPHNYWHAPDPSDSIFSDGFLDRLVDANRPYIQDDDTSMLSLPAIDDHSRMEVDDQEREQKTASNIDDCVVVLNQCQTLSDSSPSHNTIPSSSSSKEPDAKLTPSVNPDLTQGSEIMATLERERLRSECSELEAVVAELQKQLAARAKPLDEPTPVTSTQSVNSYGGYPLVCNSEFVNDDDDTQVPIQEAGGMEVIPSSQNEEEDATNQLPVTDHCELISQTGNNTILDPTQPPSSAIETSQPVVSQLTLCPNLPGLPMPSAPSSLTTCPETCQSQLEIKSTANTTKSVRDLSKLAITGSSLPSGDSKLLHEFCKRFGLVEQSQFIRGTTTHLVIKEESDRPRVVKRTLKFFLAILNRCWIVNSHWIRDCLTENKILNEDPYEVLGDTVCGDSHDGPRRARRLVPAIHPALPLASDQSSSDGRPFSGLWLSAFNGLGLLSLTDFKQLAIDGGASRVFDKPNELAKACDALTRSTTNTTGKPKAVILTSQLAKDFRLSDCQELYRKFGIPIISVDWLLNCISFYRRIPISFAYRICPAPKTGSKSDA